MVGLRRPNKVQLLMINLNDDDDDDYDKLLYFVVATVFGCWLST